jgi:hypothetical protein
VIKILAETLLLAAASGLVLIFCWLLFPTKRITFVIQPDCSVDIHGTGPTKADWDYADQLTHSCRSDLGGWKTPALGTLKKREL